MQVPRSIKKGIVIPLHNFSWKPGDSRAGGAVHFVWRIPPNPEDRDENRAFRLQAECLARITTYHTRVKKAIFYAEVANQRCIQSMVAVSNVYNLLTCDHLPRDKCKVKANATIMAEIASASQDFDIIQDLREFNGLPNNTEFDLFWCEIKSLLEPHARDDDRRHGKGYLGQVCL